MIHVVKILWLFQKVGRKHCSLFGDLEAMTGLTRVRGVGLPIFGGGR